MSNVEFNTSVLRNMIDDALEKIDSVIDENNKEQNVKDNKQYIIKQLDKIKNWSELLTTISKDERPIDVEASIRISLIEVLLHQTFPDGFKFKAWDEIKREVEE